MYVSFTTPGTKSVIYVNANAVRTLQDAEPGKSTIIAFDPNRTVAVESPLDVAMAKLSKALG